jgi:FKBP-type peptidyl-prolyl cis-trans isomerase SlyD
MTIAKDKVVSIEFTLKDDQGNTLDSNEGGDLLLYLHGAGNIVPGLETKLEGLAVGAEVSVDVAPEDGYGPRDATLVSEIPKENFDDVDEIEVGDEFQAEDEESLFLVTVTAVDEETVTVDGNHPLAGIALHFDVSIKEIRDATEDDLEHGHVHGPECDH